MNSAIDLKSYVPIASTRYSKYEAASGHHEELLICRDDEGDLRSVRLDRIRKTEPV